MNQVFQDDTQNRFFKENGYLVIKDFLSTAELGNLKDLYANNTPKNPQGFHRTLDHLDKDYKKKISDAVGTVVTPVAQRYLQDYRFSLVSYMIKEPGQDTTFEVHQNWNFVEESQFHSVAIWIPLVDVDAHNGTMHVVEGSHRIFPTFRGGPQIPSIYRDIYDHIKDNYMKPIPLRAGDALIIDDAILHYTSPNLSDSPRLAIAQVMLPQAAQALYYYQPYGKEDAPIEKYLIDDEFFLYFNNRYNLTEPPKDCELLEKFKVSTEAINATQFDELMRGKSTLLLEKEDIPLELDEVIIKDNKEAKIQGKPSFWQVYTPSNIAKEAAYKLGIYDTLFGKNKTEVSPAPPQEKPTPPTVTPIHPEHAQNVGKFYDTQHEAFIKVYGEVIQAFRTKDVSILLDQQIQSIGFEAGQRVLDAGCGICAPAVHFAKKVDISIDAITVSERQKEAAQANISKHKLEQKIQVQRGDYHQISDFFPKNHFNKVYFLESFGHSHDKEKLLGEVWKVLKSGGQVYIKDLFRKVSHSEKLQNKIDQEIYKINKAYHYHVADLNAFLDVARKLGFIIEFIRTIDLPLSAFEDLAISNEFQELTGIGKIENWAEYIFPIDFFEIRLMKPHFDLTKGMDRYFLQNLYRVQIENWKEEEL